MTLLESLLRLGPLRSDPVLKDGPFVRRSMLGRNDVTSYWWRLHDVLLRLNPDARTRRAR